MKMLSESISKSQGPHIVEEHSRDEVQNVVSDDDIQQRRHDYFPTVTPFVDQERPSQSKNHCYQLHEHQGHVE